VSNAIWLFTAAWLVAAGLAFSDLWRLSWIRTTAFLGLVAVLFTIAGALVTFAGTL
jgi:hypothetical protein